MDDIVRQAMAKWPNVPHCWGWLGLDARGQWWMRDDRAQAAGGFASGRPGARGAVLRHEKLIDFIHRNYEHDAEGRWYFQNGPQRVYVELEAAPFTWRIHEPGFAVTAHTGADAGRVDRCLLDDAGRLYLATDTGFGIVHTQDMGLAADAIEAGRWTPEEVRAQELPARFGFVPSPEATQPAAEKKAGH